MLEESASPRPISARRRLWAPPKAQEKALAVPCLTAEMGVTADVSGGTDVAGATVTAGITGGGRAEGHSPKGSHLRGSDEMTAGSTLERADDRE